LKRWVLGRYSKRSGFARPSANDRQHQDDHEIDQVMTAALSEILSKALSDGNLDLFLASKNVTSSAPLSLTN
jgi:hypothetical protein